MAFRSRTKGRRAPRKRAIWCNVPFGGVAFTESVGSQLLLTAEDWEAQFTGLAQESAVLRAVVGTIVIQQTVVGTAGTTGFWCIYVTDKDATVPPVFTVAGLSDVDILRVGAFGISTSVTGSLSAAESAATQIEIKAKRRIKSRDSVRIAAQYGADAASPAGVIGGMLRFLVARD